MTEKHLSSEELTALWRRHFAVLRALVDDYTTAEPARAEGRNPESAVGGTVPTVVDLTSACHTLSAALAQPNPGRGTFDASDRESDNFVGKLDADYALERTERD